MTGFGAEPQEKRKNLCFVAGEKIDEEVGDHGDGGNFSAFLRAMGRFDGGTEGNHLHAVDFADRLENQIIPALKSGFIVVLDRYYYTALARDVVRGQNIDWVKNLYDYAPEPDLVFYLDMPVDVLLKRIIGTTGLDFYESGRDVGFSTDFYKSFEIYQNKCLEQYDEMKKEYGFISIDGTKTIPAIHKIMNSEVQKLLDTGFLD